ncbi:uncharacterized protein B0H18DRAFT_961811 [Fomitopsis serialis]|uniref:uncharacterized protein n=1 Tax=Fomitopsis serialis TaxID=139415 RepID=UPI002007B624|nr:uncharacterized protein B0H18DRAFT_961811 [Neoantrodia serialis]KAH9911751.1 hypothetical protein B0H18DRAFT_961811 [Neoantrodia serialis]
MNIGTRAGAVPSLAFRFALAVFHPDMETVTAARQRLSEEPAHLGIRAAERISPMWRSWEMKGVSFDGDNPHAHPGQVVHTRNPSDTSDNDLFVPVKIGVPFSVEPYGEDTDHGSTFGSPTTSVGGLTFSTASIGRTNSSPPLCSSYPSRAVDSDGEVEALALAIKDWHLADEVFGDLLEDPEFPQIYNKQIERRYTQEQWAILREYLVDHKQLLRYLWFYYDEDMETLNVGGPSGLHQIATMSTSHSAIQVLEPTLLSEHQYLKVDGERIVINKWSAQKADCLLAVSFVVLDPESHGVLIHSNKDLILVQTSYSQSLDKVLHKVYKSMPPLNSPMPVAYVIINIEESAYVDDPNAKPGPQDFIPGGGYANDVLSTGWKKGENAYVGQIRGQWLMFRGTEEERNRLREGLRLKRTAADWIREGFGVDLCHKYDTSNVLQDQHDGLFAKWEEVMIECARVIGAQADSCDLDMDLAGLPERTPPPPTRVPIVEDPFPVAVKFIGMGAHQKAMDDYAMQSENHLTSFSAHTPSREDTERVRKAYKRSRDNDVPSPDDIAAVETYKKTRFADPSPPLSPSLLASDSSLEERSSDPIDLACSDPPEPVIAGHELELDSYIADDPQRRSRSRAAEFAKLNFLKKSHNSALPKRSRTADTSHSLAESQSACFSMSPRPTRTTRSAGAAGKKDGKGKVAQSKPQSGSKNSKVGSTKTKKKGLSAKEQKELQALLKKQSQAEEEEETEQRTTLRKRVLADTHGESDAEQDAEEDDVAVASPQHKKAKKSTERDVSDEPSSDAEGREEGSQRKAGQNSVESPEQRQAPTRPKPTPAYGKSKKHAGNPDIDMVEASPQATSLATSMDKPSTGRKTVPVPMPSLDDGERAIAQDLGLATSNKKPKGKQVEEHISDADTDTSVPQTDAKKAKLKRKMFVVLDSPKRKAADKKGEAKNKSTGSLFTYQSHSEDDDQDQLMEDQSSGEEYNDDDEGDDEDVDEDEDDTSGDDVVVVDDKKGGKGGKGGKGKDPASSEKGSGSARGRAKASDIPVHIKPLVNVAQSCLRLRLALDNAWTIDSTVHGARLPTSITLIKGAIKDARNHRDKEGGRIPLLKTAFDALKKDSAESLRKQVNAVVWTAASQMRNEVKKKAKNIIEHAYDMSRLTTQQRTSLAQWLLKTHGVKIKSVGDRGDRRELSRANRELPFQHKAIADIISQQWFQGHKESGARAAVDRFRAVPDNLIAFVCNAIEAALKDLASGTQIQFANKQYAPKWDSLMAVLELFKSQAPQLYEDTKKKLWRDIGARIDDVYVSSSEGEDEEDDDGYIPFAQLEAKHKTRNEPSKAPHTPPASSSSKDVIASSSGGNGKPSPKKSPLVSKAGDDTTAGPSKLLNANDDDDIMNARVDQVDSAAEAGPTET